MQRQGVIVVIMLLVLAASASAAVIHGSVYDLELNTLRQAVVEIDTVPRQVMVSANGTYTFTVGPGDYVITARHTRLDASAAENITIQNDGNYVLDLILFPNLDEEEELLNETLEVADISDQFIQKTGIDRIIIAFAILVIVGAFGWVWYQKREAAKQEGKSAPKETAEAKKPVKKADLEEILAFIRKEGGRATQKDLRKAIPYSEAKISLMIAELEAAGKLQKIKKGRGNILVLQ